MWPTWFCAYKYPALVFILEVLLSGHMRCWRKYVCLVCVDLHLEFYYIFIYSLGKFNHIKKQLPNLHFWITLQRNETDFTPCQYWCLSVSLLNFNCWNCILKPWDHFLTHCGIYWQISHRVSLHWSPERAWVIRSTSQTLHTVFLRSLEHQMLTWVGNHSVIRFCTTNIFLKSYLSVHLIKSNSKNNEFIYLWISFLVGMKTHALICSVKWWNVSIKWYIDLNFQQGEYTWCS